MGHVGGEVEEGAGWEQARGEERRQHVTSWVSGLLCLACSGGLAGYYGVVHWCARGLARAGMRPLDIVFRDMFFVLPVVSAYFFISFFSFFSLKTLKLCMSHV
jgi:TRAP-type C4-dicarboxylate transport system permease small subunit